MRKSSDKNHSEISNLKPKMILCDDGIERRIIDETTFKHMLKSYQKQIAVGDKEIILDFSCSYFVFELNNYCISTKLEESSLKKAKYIWLGFSYNKYTCEVGVDFTNSIFTENVNLSDLHFCKGVNFMFCQFNKNIEVQNTFFSEPVQFIQIKCKGLAKFNKTTFSHNIGFNKSIFRDLDFSDAIFKGNVYFIYSEFLGSVNFRNTTFEQWLDLEETIFEFPFEFTFSTFQGQLSLANLKFKNNTDCITFESPVIKEHCSMILNFETGNYPKLVFKLLTISESIKWLKIIALKNKEENQVVFDSCVMPKGSVDIISCQMVSITVRNGNWFQGLELEYSTWPSINGHKTLNTLTSEALNLAGQDTKTEVYRYLKKITADLGQTQVSNDFYFQQMLSVNQTIWHHLYRITSSYGLSFRRPLFCFLGFLILFMLIYSVVLGDCKFPCPHFDINYWLALLELSIENSFILSTKISIIDISKILSPHSWGSIFYAVSNILQHLFQTFLFVQMGLAIKNKVKR